MNEIEWAKIPASLLGGGAVGALITTFITGYRSRIQPVGYRIEFLPIFKDTLGSSSLHVQVTLFEESSDKSQKYGNLHLAQIRLLNKGNKDFDQFTFGATLSGGDTAVYIEPQSPDRHHQIRQLTQLKLDEPKSEIDFALCPFNRKDSYVVQLFIVTPQGHESPSEIKLSSAQPINFQGMPTATEIFRESAESVTIEFGPLKLSMRPGLLPWKL